MKTQKPEIKNAAILIRSIEIHKPIAMVFIYIIYELKDNYQAMAQELHHPDVNYLITSK